MLSALQTRTVLRNLIQLCKNAERGFTVAREGLTDGELRVLFRQFAQERARQAAEVCSELEHQCPEAREEDSSAGAWAEGSTGGFVPCAWTGIRSALNSEDEFGLIHKCDEGTDCLLKTYEDVLRAPLPRTTRALLHRHLVQTRSMQGVLKSLARLD